MGRKTDKEFEKVERELEKIELELVEKSPHHFSTRDVVNAFFGAFLVAITFIFKGNFIRMAFSLPWENVVFVVLFTLLFLSAEIYFIGYKKVTDKNNRKPFQFLFKRLVTFYGVGILVSGLLIFLFNIEHIAVSDFLLSNAFGMQGIPASVENIQKLLLILAFPASIGAGISDLVKKYY